jgi:hypothetical protein
MIAPHQLSGLQKSGDAVRKRGKSRPQPVPVHHTAEMTSHLQAIGVLQSVSSMDLRHRNTLLPVQSRTSKRLTRERVSPLMSGSLLI